MQYRETVHDKKQLVDTDRIIRAVDFLAEKGVDLDHIPVELSRAFYVDLDELNAVLSTRRRAA
jgi:hypothetical protein